MEKYQSLLQQAAEMPISAENYAGENAVFSDEFDLIKTEVNKLENCNYQKVLENSLIILTRQSKDLRVAGYLTLSLGALFKLSGIIKGLEIMSHTLLGDNFPKSASAKIAALKWLNNRKLRFFLKDVRNFDNLSDTITNLNTIIINKFGDNAPAFNILKNIIPSKKIVTKVIPQPQDIKTKNIDNHKDAQLALKKLCLFYKSHKNLLEYCALTRNRRWLDFSIPTVVETITRASGKQQLEIFYNNQEWEALFNLSEAMFLEPGGAYFLELQFFSYTAAMMLENNLLAQYIKSNTQWLTNSYPILKKLKFANNELCYSARVLQWLGNQKVATIPQEEQQFKEILNKAQYFLNLKNYDAAYIFFNELFEKIYNTKFYIWHFQKAQEYLEKITAFFESKHAQNYQTTQTILKIKKIILLR